MNLIKQNNNSLLFSICLCKEDEQIKKLFSFNYSDIKKNILNDPYFLRKKQYN